jgi:ribosomal protein S18 acetylase RimI-like enzyme
MAMRPWGLSIVAAEGNDRDMRIRPAAVTDAERIAEIHVRSWQAGYRGLLPQPFLDGLRPSERAPRWTMIVQQAAWPHQGTLVADDAGEVVGFTDFRPTRDDDQNPAEVGEITTLYVLPAAWGRGIGRQLMIAAVDALSTAGYTSATLWVLATNTRAIRFYDRSGWKPDGTRKDDVVGGTTISELRYRRPVR